MSKNLEELKKIEDRIFKTDIKKFDEKALTYMMEKIAHCIILVLEGFEKRLKTIEDKMGLFPLGNKKKKNYKIGGTDPD